MTNRRTKTISVVIHDKAYPMLRDLADEKADGSMSTLIMILIYAELVKYKYMTYEQMMQLVAPS
jgi:hypothetical protein